MLGLVDCRGRILATSDDWIMSYSRKCLGFVVALLDVELNLLQQQIFWLKEDALRAQKCL